MLTSRRVLLVVTGATAASICAAGFLHIALAQTVGAGQSHSAVLLPGGAVATWGYNGHGQLGDGTTSQRLVPTTVSGSFTAIAVGSSYTLALKSDGTAWAWGYNGDGQLGDGTRTRRSTPVQVLGLTGVVAIAAGDAHSVALKSDGTVWAWGYNGYGQLGDGTTTSRPTPVQMLSVTGATSISAGSSHTLVGTSSGVLAVGYNGHGQLGNGTSTSRSTVAGVAGVPHPIALAAGSSHSLALAADGTIWAWGDNASGQLGNGTNMSTVRAVHLTTITGVSQISASNHSLAVRTDGTAWSWGHNGYGQLGDGKTMSRNSPEQVPGLSAVVGVAAGAYHSLAITSGGVVYTWGNNGSGQLGDGTTRSRTSPQPMSEANYAWKVGTPQFNDHTGTDTTTRTVTVTEATSGATIYYTLDGTTPTTASRTVTSGGTVAVTKWQTLKANATRAGLRTSGTAGAMSPVVAAGFASAFLIEPDGTLWSWGFNDQGQLGDGTHVNRSRPAQVANIPAFRTVSANYKQAFGIDPSGGLWGWGFNMDGEIGNGTTTAVSPPVQVLTQVEAVALGNVHTLALRSDGTVWAWGDNHVGSLGDGTTTRRTSPQQVPGLSGVVGIAANGLASYAVLADGSVRGWGQTYQFFSGLHGPGYDTPTPIAGLSGVTAMAVALTNVFALESDGSVWAWGDGYFGLNGDGSTTTLTSPARVPGLPPIKSMASGYTHVLALAFDGTVWAWGSNVYGELGDGTTTQPNSPIQIPGLSEVISIAAGLYDSLAVTSSGTVYTWGFNSYGQLGNGLPTSPPVLTPTAISGSNYDWSVDIPHFSLPGGTYNTTLNVTVSCGTPGATIYYTLDGTTPTTASPIVTNGGTVAITQSQTLKANAVKSGSLTSTTAVAVYTLQAHAPSASPFPGTYTAAQTVTLDDATPGVTLRYTLDGSTPSVTSPVYSTPLDISTQTTLQAYASKAGWVDSDVFSATYNFNFGILVAPTASPAAGTYTSAVTVTLSGPPGATIRYTTDGSTPTATSSVYTGPIALTQTTTLNAASFRTDYATSQVTSLLYTVTVATPLLSKGSGAYPAGTTMTVTDSTPGAIIHYTLDGTDPTATSPTIASGATFVIGDYTLKAKATKAGCTDSAIASASYAVSGTLPVALTAFTYAAMLASDGAVWFWGGNKHPTPTLIPELTGVTAVSVGGNFILALKLDGTVWSLGDPTRNDEVVSQVSGLSSIIAISTGIGHALALRSDGTVWAWGYNYNGQLGQNTSVLFSATPLQVDGLFSVTQIAAGSNSSYALIASKAWAWGDNQYGELGDGTLMSRWNPEPAAVTLSSITQIEGGGVSALALTADGKLWGWGGNYSGQLGDGTLVNRLFPVPISLPATRTMAMGFQHALALDQAGAVWAWGDNRFGELGDNSMSDGLSPIQVPLPSTVIAIAAGYNCSLAATAGGTVWAWGWNSAFCGGDGTKVQLGTPEQISSDGPRWRVPPPTLTPPSGDFNSAVSVSVSGDPSAEIHYTLDGTTPTAASPLLAPGAKIQISVSTTLLVIAVKGTDLPSVPVGGRYSLKPAKPSATPSPGTYAVTLNVQLSTTPSGSSIRYTLDGTDPGAASTLYQDPIPIISSTRLKARAFKDGWDDGDILLAIYTLQLGTLDTPVISPNGGNFQAPTSVSISVPSGATVRYTLDGSEPTQGSEVYGGAFLISRPATLKAKAFRKDYVPSSTATAKFQFTVPPPDFSLSSGTYRAGTRVSVTSQFTGAHILYTVDGKDPVGGGGAVDALSPAMVTLGNFTLKARAFLPGVLQSSVAARTYSVTGKLPKSLAQLAFSETVVLYANEAGQLASWGRNADGQLGDGTTNDASLPRLVDLPGPVRSVAAGHAFGIVALDDGSVWAWGSNAGGQLGDGTTTGRDVPGQVAGLTNIVQVAAGDSTAYAVGSNGSVWAWGSNSKGQLGSGNTSASLSPRIVTGLASVRALSAGPTRAVALLQDGTLAQWGSNPTNAGQPILAPTGVGGGTFVTVAASDTHTLASKADGTAYAFGSNTAGELGVATSTASSVSPLQVPGISDAAWVAAGEGFSWVCSGAGTCWAFGDNSFGELGVPYAQPGTPVGLTSVPGAEGVTSVAAQGKTAGFPTTSGPRFYGQQPWAVSSTTFPFNPGSVSGVYSGPTIPQLLGFAVQQTVQYFWWSVPPGSTLSDDHLRLVVTGVDHNIPGSTLAHFPNVVTPAESITPVGGDSSRTYSASFRVPYDTRGGAYIAVSSRGVPNDFLGELKAAGNLSPPVVFDNIQSIIAVPDDSGGGSGHILVADDRGVWDVDLFARDFTAPTSMRDGKYFLSRVSRDGYFFAVEREQTDPVIFRAHVSAPDKWEKWASTSPLGSAVTADGIAATEDGTWVYVIDSANQNIISIVDRTRPQYVWDKNNLPLKPRVFKSPSGLELQNGTLIFLTTDSSQRTLMQQFSIYGFPVRTDLGPTLAGNLSVRGLEADRALFDAQPVHPMRYIFSAAVAGALVSNKTTGVAGRVFATQDKTRLLLGFGTSAGVESREFGGHRIFLSTQPGFGAGYVDGSQLADGLATVTVYAPVDVDVFVSALDPPDPSAYVSASSDDNNAGSPEWGLSMSQDGSSPSRCVQYHSDSNPTSGALGLADRTVFLRMPRGSGGDNVRLKVGLVPPTGTDCSASGPVRGFSGLYTSWKRLYVQVDRMYKRGGVLAEDALAGSTGVRIAAARTSLATQARNYDRGTVDIRAGDPLRIFGWDNEVPGLIQSEIACVGADPSWGGVAGQVATVPLVSCSNPTKPYLLQNNYKANYSDSDGEYKFISTYGVSGVAPIPASGLTSDDIFAFGITGFGDVFADGYVDLYVLPPTPSSPGRLPYVPQGWLARGDVYVSELVPHSIVELSNATFGRAQSLGEREIAAQNLVHLLIAGDGPVLNNEPLAGLTLKAPFYMTWLFGNKILSSGSGSNEYGPLRFRWVTAHELAHQFGVNSCTADGHDVRNGWPSEIQLPHLPPSSCLMIRAIPKVDEPLANAYFCREDLLFGDPTCGGAEDATHPRPGSIRAAPDPLR